MGHQSKRLRTKRGNLNNCRYQEEYGEVYGEQTEGLNRNQFDKDVDNSSDYSQIGREADLYEIGEFEPMERPDAYNLGRKVAKKARNHQANDGEQEQNR